MTSEIYHLLQKQPVLPLFLILGIGYLIGGLKVRGFSLGSVAGVLFAGLFFGHFGFKMSPGAQSVGFALFIFSVGYQAGPRFFDVLMEDGLKYFCLALFIAGTGFGLAVIAAKIMALPPGTAAGILAGGLTSSPTLAAAQEAIRSGNMVPPAGVSPDTVIGNITTGYAITYIFGLAGLIAIIKLMPGLLGIDLAAEARKIEGRDQSPAAEPRSQVEIRVYRVDNKKFTEIPVAELKERYWDGFSVVRVERDGKILEPAPEDHLEPGDTVIILGRLDYFTDEIKALGEEITATR
jgi:putative transport protein